MPNYENHIDPLNHDALAASLDETNPGWRESEVDPEDRLYVDANDVQMADEPLLTFRYGGDHGAMMPNQYGEYM